MPDTLADGRYVLRRRIGEGGIGTVDEAWDELYARAVAIKRLLPQHARSVEAVRRFERECRVLARLQHPCIVDVYDVEHSEDGLLLVMELVDGIPADAWVEGSEDPLAAALEVTLQAAEALAYAHASGVVHRDLKPDNLLVKPNGGLRVLDFGLARSTIDETITASDEVVGTLVYVAPEQLRSHRVDARADLYALGVVLFRLLTGRVPYEDRPDAAPLLVQILTAEPPRPSAINGRLTPVIDDLVLRLLQRNPQARPSCASELAEQLRAMVGSA